ncbi:NAD(P)H-binding protein [Humidisolicoccus flavus]|uniref:NAD(P)H-binding protein n=1 Tax=Humidisolicoccus flavus TaxID=3111414 RepID=UPI003248CCB5
MSTVAIIGAHGQIAQILGKELVARGHEVLGAIRNGDHSSELEALGVKPVLFDIESEDADVLASRIPEADVVVFAAGAGGNSGPERKHTVDFLGSVISIGAAQKIGASKFLQISYIGVDGPAPESDDESWNAYAKAKKAADDALRASDLAWTIVRPGHLSDEPASGTVTIAESLSTGATSRANVALVLAELVDSENTGHRALDVLDGDVAIAEAVEEFLGE